MNIIIIPRITLVLPALFFSGLFVSDAYAYIDPGTGSAAIQILIGALAGIAITLKLYWYKIREKLSKK